MHDKGGIRKMLVARSARNMAMLLCSLALLSACALPGYDFDDGNGGYWYGAGAKATWPEGGPPEEIHYDARMVLISPELIRHLRHQHAGEPLRPSVKRSEEHTSELQSRGHLVCRLLLEKKK